MNGRENDTESNSDLRGSGEPSPQSPSENSISSGATGGTVFGAASGRISNDSTAMASADSMALLRIGMRRSRFQSLSHLVLSDFSG